MINYILDKAWNDMKMLFYDYRGLSNCDTDI